MPQKIKAPQHNNKVLNAAADVPDLRDRFYEPALVRLEHEVDPFKFKKQLYIRDQGQDGACTGFSLAAAIDLLNTRRGMGNIKVSARMLYEMARRFDEWTGEEYEGSSLRGAIRGWYHNGVCPENEWPYHDPDHQLTVKRAKSARVNTLGAYYRLKTNLTDFHAALTETGVICASARVHNGWFNVKPGARIVMNKTLAGGHAFAIVGYNREGFWIQNSWGPGWGKGGLALWLYEDWAMNLMDAWVFRMAVPTPQVFDLRAGAEARDKPSREQWTAAPRRQEIAGHFVHIDDGEFYPRGRYANTAEDIAVTARQFIDSAKKYAHLLIYAHGGLNSARDSAKRIRAMKNVFKDNGIYPLHFMYETGLCEELKDVVLRGSKQIQERVGGFFDFTDRILELAIGKPGTLLWNEMKKDARITFDSGRAGVEVLRIFGEALASTRRKIQVHLVGHSTGAIFLAHLLEALDRTAEWKTPLAGCHLMAPACSLDLYRKVYRPRLKGQGEFHPLPKLHVYNLSDSLERNDNVAQLYRKSLLYLVSNAFETRPAMPLLGMEKFSKKLKDPKLKFIYPGGEGALKTRSHSHGGFDNDPDTLNSILGTVLGGAPKRRFTKKDLDY